MVTRAIGLVIAAFAVTAPIRADEITAAGEPARLDIRAAGQHSVRVTLMPRSVEREFPFSPALAERDYPAPVISLPSIGESVKASVGTLNVEVRPGPLTVIVTTADGKPAQEVTFDQDGTLLFRT